VKSKTYVGVHRLKPHSRAQYPVSKDKECQKYLRITMNPEAEEMLQKMGSDSDAAIYFC
jgi:uncharacterized protein YpbB